MIALNRNNTSSILMLTFMAIITLGALTSEFFQAPILSSQEMSKLQYLLNPLEVSDSNELSLKTSLGEFELKKERNVWNLTSPRVINADQQTVRGIIETLKEIKIKKVYPKDPINLANFSLDNPISTIQVKSEKYLRKISFGLINPVDNSTYVTLENDEAIYHVNVPTLGFEKIDLSALIDSKIFSITKDTIKHFKIINNKNSTTLEFKRAKDFWVSGKSKLNDQKLEAYIGQLHDLKSTIIIDKKTEQLTKRLNRYLERPFFKISVETNSGEKILYEISYIINSLPDLKMEKKQNFIIRASNKIHPFLVNRSYMNLFYKTHRSFKPIPINKLIY